MSEHRSAGAALRGLWKAVALAALVAAGCGKDPNIPHVVYPDAAPLPPPDKVFTVPEWGPGVPAFEFQFPEAAQAGSRIAFEGTISGEPVADRPVAILVLIEGRHQTGTVNFVNTAGNQVNRSGDPFTYQVSLEGPKTPGQYKVSIFPGGGNAERGPIATAELTVQSLEP
jgi:hypothetical protein